MGDEVAKRRTDQAWDGPELGRRREFRSRLLVSAIAHSAVLLVFAFTPAPAARPLPPVVTVHLLSHLPGAPAPPRARPAPPAPPKPSKIVLPRQAPAARAQPGKVPPRPRARPKELEYADALAKLREELGEATPEAIADEPGESQELASATGGAGEPASPELLDWIRDTKRHVRRTYITPPEFLNRGLITCMEVLLTADGRVIGEPALLRSSGDPFWDDNAARAVARASPLPAPPADGEWIFCFPSEERQ